MEVLNAKCKTRIGFWNVQTMYESERLAQVTYEMRCYNLHILGISETWWTGSGKHMISIGETALYSSRDDTQHLEGAAIILEKGTEKCLMEWKPVNSRLMKVRMRGKHINTTIIQCYTPTSDSDEETKGAFYEQLQSELEQTPWDDLKILIGELNAKVGNDNTNYGWAMKSEGCRTINDNRKQLLELCTTKDLIIGETLFPTQWHAQDDLVLPQWKRQEPDQQIFF